VSEDQEQRGSVEVPKLGKVPKPVLFGVGGLAAAFVGWRWYAARKAAAAAPADPGTGTDPGFQDPGTLPQVQGAAAGVSGLPYADPTAGVGTVGDYGFTGTTNSQWTEYAAQQLQQSDTWSYTDVVGALGQYLAHRPLSQLQVQIVQAAIAVAGSPPVGSFSVVPGGEVGISVAPSGLQVTHEASTSVNLTWFPVAGAHGYLVDAHGVSKKVTGTATTLTGLHPGTAYQVTVQAEAGNGELGPASDPVTAHTAAASAPAPRPPAKGGGGKRYPARKQWHVKLPKETYASIAHALAPGFTAEELFAYQSNPAAGHTAAAAAKLHHQGVGDIANGQSIAIPYPK
jgi:hypothetical protein